MIKRVHIQGLTAQQIRLFEMTVVQANDDQVIAMMKTLFKRVPTNGLHKILELVDQEYDTRGLKL